MAKPTTHEALIYIMVVVSAADSDMTDAELERIGAVLRWWPIFEDFDSDRLIATAQACQKKLGDKQGLDGILALAREVIPARLHDTAYALAAEVAHSDLEMRMEERRVLQLLRDNLAVDDKTAAAIDRATKARHRTLT